MKKQKYFYFNEAAHRKLEKRARLVGFSDEDIILGGSGRFDEAYKAGTLRKVNDAILKRLNRVLTGGKPFVYHKENLVDGRNTDNRALGGKMYSIQFKSGQLLVHIMYSDADGTLPAGILITRTHTAKDGGIFIPIAKYIGQSFNLLADIVASIRKDGAKSPYLNPDSALTRKINGIVIGRHVNKSEEDPNDPITPQMMTGAQLKKLTTPLLTTAHQKAASFMSGAMAAKMDLEDALKLLQRDLENNSDKMRGLHFVTGDAGAGKSHTIEKYLEMNFPGGWEKIGNASYSGLFIALNKNRNKFILMDDAGEAVLKLPETVSLLKNLAQTDPEKRIVRRETSVEIRDPEDKGKLDSQFLFEGCLIVVTNHPIDKLFVADDLKAIRSRAFVTEFNINPDSVLEYIKKIYTTLKVKVQGGRVMLPPDELASVFDWFYNNAKEGNFLSQRRGAAYVTIRAFETCIQLWYKQKPTTKEAFEAWAADCLRVAE